MQQRIKCRYLVCKDIFLKNVSYLPNIKKKEPIYKNCTKCNKMYINKSRNPTQNLMILIKNVDFFEYVP